MQVCTSVDSSSIPASAPSLMRSTAKQLRPSSLGALVLINPFYLELGSTKITGLETCILPVCLEERYIQFFSNGPCCGKLKLQLCKSHQS